MTSSPPLVRSALFSLSFMLVCVLGCGDDPSRDAGQIDMAKAKAQAAADGQASPDLPVGKKTQSKGPGRVRPNN